MTDKLLPLPVGGGSPTGSDVHFWQQYRFRSRLASAALSAAFVLAALGTWLGLSPAQVPVAIDSAGYHVGTSTIPTSGPGSYDGDVAIRIRQLHGETRAAAAGKLGAVLMQGLCTFVPGSTSEQCTFVVGRASFHAVDTLDNNRWRRRYDNGREVDIPFPDGSHPVPVPIPIGWG